MLGLFSNKSKEYKCMEFAKFYGFVRGKNG